MATCAEMDYTNWSVVESDSGESADSYASDVSMTSIISRTNALVRGAYADAAKLYGDGGSSSDGRSDEDAIHAARFQIAADMAVRAVAAEDSASEPKQQHSATTKQPAVAAAATAAVKRQKYATKQKTHRRHRPCNSGGVAADAHVPGGSSCSVSDFESDDSVRINHYQKHAAANSNNNSGGEGTGRDGDIMFSGGGYNNIALDRGQFVPFTNEPTHQPPEFYNDDNEPVGQREQLGEAFRFLDGMTDTSVSFEPAELPYHKIERTFREQRMEVDGFREDDIPAMQACCQLCYFQVTGYLTEDASAEVRAFSSLYQELSLSANQYMIWGRMADHWNNNVVADHNAAVEKRRKIEERKWQIHHNGGRQSSSSTQHARSKTSRKHKHRAHIGPIPVPSDRKHHKRKHHGSGDHRRYSGGSSTAMDDDHRYRRAGKTRTECRSSSSSSSSHYSSSSSSVYTESGGRSRYSQLVSDNSSSSYGHGRGGGGGGGARRGDQCVEQMAGRLYSTGKFDVPMEPTRVTPSEVMVHFTECDPSTIWEHREDQRTFRDLLRQLRKSGLVAEKKIGGRRTGQFSVNLEGVKCYMQVQEAAMKNTRMLHSIATVDALTRGTPYGMMPGIINPQKLIDPSKMLRIQGSSSKHDDIQFEAMRVATGL